MGGSSQTTQDTTSNQINQIPQWMSDAGQQNYAYAQNVAQQPLQQYQGQMVADVSPQTQQAWDVAANSGNVGSDQFNAATAGYLGALGQTPTSVSASTYNPSSYNASTYDPTSYNASTYGATGYNASQTGSSNLSRYMDPYTQSVINATLPLMQQQNALAQNQQADAAASAKAFGGSRQGIQQGVAQAQGALNIGQMAAQLNSANYNQARAASESDVAAQNAASQFSAGALNAAGQYNAGNIQSAAAANAAAANAAGQFNAGAQNSAGQFNAGAQNAAGQFNAGAQNAASLANQQAAQAKINSDIVASQGLNNTGDSMNKSNVSNYQMLQGAGASQSMQQQNQINAQMAKFNQAFNYPQQQLGVLESSLGMTPHDTSTSGQSNTTTTTPTDWASIMANTASAAGSIYGMLPSDRRLKKDIEKVGKDPVGVPSYAFRYKGADPKSPKIVGPMAQDVQKVAPEAVGELPGSGGKLGIHMPTLDDARRRAPIPLGGQHIRTPRGYAAGTPFVGQPSLAAFVPPSSPGVAKGIGAMSAFRPPVRFARGAGVPKMQRFAFGSADVQAPNMDDVDLGDQIMGGDTFTPKASPPPAKSSGGSPQSGGKGPPAPPPLPPGWGAPSMGYFSTGFAYGTPGVTDTVPAMLTPGEAVLTPRAAQHLGRGNIARLNAFMPPVNSQATAMPRAGARGLAGALANTKVRPKVAGGLSG